MRSAKEIDALLPQTQCGECGYPGCLPYAQALAQGVAPIDRCPPGGVHTLNALATMLNIDPSPYLHAVETNTRAPSLAMIREADCIGCTKCIQACPVDAIIGSGKFMHTVIEHECTGCGLCVEPCPVDCIEMLSQSTATYDRDLARDRYQDKQVRLLRDEQEKQQAYRDKRRLADLSIDQQQDKSAKQDFILQALARAQSKGSKHE